MIFIGAVLLLAFLPALWNGFVWDDATDIVDSDRLRSWGSVIEVFRHDAMWSAKLGQGGVGTYRPLSLASFAIDYKLYGLRSAGYHLTNIILHVVAQIFLFRLLLHLGITVLAAAGLTLLCGLHPSTVESVVWINGRSEILALLFGAAALSLARGEGRVRLRLLLLPLLLLLAMLGKETGSVFVPLSVLIAALSAGPGRARRIGLTLGAAAAAVGVYLLLRVPALRGTGVSSGGFLLSAIRVLPALWMRALEAALLPLDRSLLNLWTWYRGLSAAQLLVYDLAAGALVLLLPVLLWRGPRWAGVGLLWWLAALCPASFIVALQGSWPGLNRWLYVSLPGLMIALYHLVGPRLRGRVRIAVPLVLILVSLVLTELAIPVWRDDLRLFARMIDETPEAAYGYRQVAAFLLNRGRYPEAVALCEQGLRTVDPAERQPLHPLLAKALALAGRCDEAVAMFREHGESEQVPFFAFAGAAGSCYEQAGQADRARAMYRICAAVTPGCAQAYEKLRGDAPKR